MNPEIKTLFAAKTMTTNETYDLDADIIAAANPYGCNQYGHREGHGDEGTTEAKTKHLNANAEKLSKMLDLQELQNSGASADKIAKAKKELQDAERNWANAGSELKRKEQEAQARKKARESTPAAPSKTVTTATNKELKRQMSEAEDLYADDDYGVAGDKAYAEHEENIKDVGNNWRSGSFSAGGRTYKVQMQIYPRSHKDEASQFGIEGGDISKFWVRDDNGDVVVNYDRGWDIKPKKEETKMMMRTLLEKYNGTKEDADSVKSSRASGYDLDAEILLAANPYRIPSDADLVEAERGCNQYKHKPGCPEEEGGGPKQSEPEKHPEKTRISREVDELKKMAEAATSTHEEKRKKISNSNDSQIGKGIRLDEVQRNASYVKRGLQELERAKARYEEALNIMSDPNYDPEFLPETSVWYDGGGELEKRRKHYEIIKRDLSKAIDEYQKL